MYILLNLRDPTIVSKTLDLLFRNGYTSMSVGEKVEDLCPVCDRSPTVVPPGQNDPDRSRFVSSTSLISNRDFVPNSSTRTYSNGGSFPVRLLSSTSQPVVGHNPAAPISSIPINLPFRKEIPIQVLDADTFTTICDAKAESQPSQNGNNTIIPQYITSNVKLEHGLEDETEYYSENNTSCGTSFLSAEMHVEDEVEAQKEVDQKRKRTQKRVAPSPEPPRSPMVFECQICLKKLHRTTMTDLFTHLDRHARLHASRRQFGCTACEFSFTRRYLAKNHITASHPGKAHVVDYSSQLKPEYHTLLKACFPEAAILRRGAEPDQESDDE